MGAAGVVGLSLANLIGGGDTGHILLAAAAIAVSFFLVTELVAIALRRRNQRDEEDAPRE